MAVRGSSQGRAAAARVRQEQALFETGYGPSGPAAYRHFRRSRAHDLGADAFTRLTGGPSRLIAFSDDMDGLRKVPDNVLNRDMLSGIWASR